MSKKVLSLLGACVVVLGGLASQSQAAIINWNIDSANSYIRLNLPLNTSSSISGVNVNLRLRNADNGTWSDAGGRRSNFGGTVQTNYSEADNPVFNPVDLFQYMPGGHNMNSINFSSFRPNPAQFDPTATNGANPNGQYTGGSGAPASFAVRINANALIFVNATIGYLALRDLQYTAAGTLTLSGAGGNFTSSGGQFGLQGGKYDLDANDIGLGLGQLLPDEANGNLGGLLGSSSGLQNNTGGLTITNLGGLDRRLDQVINIPLQIDVGDGLSINGSIEGHMRAFATVPEPASVSMVALAFGALSFRRRHRR